MRLVRTDLPICFISALMVAFVGVERNSLLASVFRKLKFLHLGSCFKSGRTQRRDLTTYGCLSLRLTVLSELVSATEDWGKWAFTLSSIRWVSRFRLVFGQLFDTFRDQLTAPPHEYGDEFRIPFVCPVGLFLVALVRGPPYGVVGSSRQVPVILPKPAEVFASNRLLL